MAEGRPPNNDISSMEQLLELPNRPPPKLSKPQLVSDQFNKFIEISLVKDPQLRPTSIELLMDPWVQQAKGSEVLSGIIRNYLEIQKSSSEET